MPAPGEERSIWVGGLAPGVSESEVRQLFGQFGMIREVRMLSMKNCCFINYVDMNDAVRCYREARNIEMNGWPLKVGWGKSRPAGSSFGGGGGGGGPRLSEPSALVWIGGVNEMVSELQVREAIQAVAPVEHVRMVPHKSCAFVRVHDVEAATLVIQRLNNSMIGGVSVRMNYGKDNNPRGGMGSSTRVFIEHECDHRLGGVGMVLE